jgi:hypothetical protein
LPRATARWKRSSTVIPASICAVDRDDITRVTKGLFAALQSQPHSQTQQ